MSQTQAAHRPLARPALSLVQPDAKAVEKPGLHHVPIWKRWYVSPDPAALQACMTARRSYRAVVEKELVGLMGQAAPDALQRAGGRDAIKLLRLSERDVRRLSNHAYADHVERLSTAFATWSQERLEVLATRRGGDCIPDEMVLGDGRILLSQRCADAKVPRGPGRDALFDSLDRRLRAALAAPNASPHTVTHKDVEDAAAEEIQAWRSTQAVPAQQVDRRSVQRARPLATDAVLGARHDALSDAQYERWFDSATRQLMASLVGTLDGQDEQAQTKALIRALDLPGDDAQQSLKRAKAFLSSAGKRYDASGLDWQSVVSLVRQVDRRDVALHDRLLIASAHVPVEGAQQFGRVALGDALRARERAGAPRLDPEERTRVSARLRRRIADLMKVGAPIAPLSMAGAVQAAITSVMRPGAQAASTQAPIDSTSPSKVAPSASGDIPRDSKEGPRGGRAAAPRTATFRSPSAATLDPRMQAYQTAMRAYNKILKSMPVSARLAPGFDIDLYRKQFQQELDRAGQLASDFEALSEGHPRAMGMRPTLQAKRDEAQRAVDGHIKTLKAVLLQSQKTLALRGR